MRLFCAVIASIALVGGAPAVRAHIAASGAGGVTIAAGPRPPAAVDEPGASRKMPANAIRVAQVGASTAPETLFSGNPSLAPYKWVGMLQNPTPTKQHPNAYAYCTGQFITPKVVLTAGHCLKDLDSSPTGPGFDLSKSTFILQYQNGTGSQTYKIVCGATNPLWAYPSNFASLSAAQKLAAEVTAWQHDFAMFLVDGTSQTGVMPYALDWKGKANYAYRIGYPENILADQIVQVAPGVVFSADALPLGPYASPNLVVQWGPVTDATQGMSGGAWVVNPNATEGPNNNILIAVTSFSPINGFNAPVFPGGTFAPYLTAAEFNPLLTSVSNGCK